MASFKEEARRSNRDALAESVEAGDDFAPLGVAMLGGGRSGGWGKQGKARQGKIYWAN